MSVAQLYPQAKKKVGVLGATGTVGQRFILLLSSHPFFVLHALGASARSAGKPYALSVKWKQASPIPDGVRGMVVRECKPEGGFKECEVVFSGLDAEVAGDIESAFRAAEHCVFSNSKNFRRDPLCPLIVPLVNPSHLALVPAQRASLSPPLKKGFIVTNANCSTTGLVVPLKALEDAFGPIEFCVVTTLQAISGAGYPGVSSLDILDNVVPHIGGEEEKMEWETSKILGLLSPSSTSHILRSDPASPLGSILVSATTMRVPVLDGHTESVSIKFRCRPPPSVDDCKAALRSYRCEPQEMGCPSAPLEAIFVHEEEDRPQPRLDRYYQDGAGVSVGRVRKCPVFDIKFVVLLNNVSIGAATSSVMNAELAVAKGVI